MSPARVATGSRIRERTLANRERILFLVSERAMSKSGGVWNGWNGGFEYGVDKVISGMQNVLVRCQKIMAATYIRDPYHMIIRGNFVINPHVL